MRNYMDEMEAAYMTSKRQGGMMRDSSREHSPYEDRRNHHSDYASQTRGEMYGRSTEPKRQTMDFHQPAGDADAEDKNHCGKGPKNYKRSDERIRELVCERLCDDPELDASDIDVEVKEGEVTLKGEVKEKFEKYLAEDLAIAVTGVKDVQNLIRVNSRQMV